MVNSGSRHFAINLELDPLEWLFSRIEAPTIVYCLAISIASEQDQVRVSVGQGMAVPFSRFFTDHFDF